MTQSKLNSKFLVILVTISLLLLNGCASINQLPPASPSKDIMERSNRIIITIDEEPSDAFRNVGQYLSDLGFGFHNTNESLLNIQTNFSTFGNPPFGTYSLRVIASIRDSSIHFYAFTGLNILGDRKEINSDFKREWDKLIEIATGYPHNEVYYSRN